MIFSTLDTVQSVLVTKPSFHYFWPKTKRVVRYVSLKTDFEHHSIYDSPFLLACVAKCTAKRGDDDVYRAAREVASNSGPL